MVEVVYWDGDHHYVGEKHIRLSLFHENGIPEMKLRCLNYWIADRKFDEKSDPLNDVDDNGNSIEEIQISELEHRRLLNIQRNNDFLNRLLSGDSSKVCK